MTGGEKTRLRESPDNIHRDLEALQRSVFSTFQIKEPKPNLSNYSPPLYSLTARDTHSYSTYNLPIRSPQTVAPPQVTRSPNLVTRAKSAVAFPTRQ
jgi:hypothetical protein